MGLKGRFGKIAEAKAPGAFVIIVACESGEPSSWLIPVTHMRSQAEREDDESNHDKDKAGDDSPGSWPSQVDGPPYAEMCIRDRFKTVSRVIPSSKPSPSGGVMRMPSRTMKRFSPVPVSYTHLDVYKRQP